MVKLSEDLPFKREEYAKEIPSEWHSASSDNGLLSAFVMQSSSSSKKNSDFELYTRINQAGEAYMAKSITNQSHTEAPTSKKAMSVVKNHLL